MSTHTIAVAGKGGVGKTTICGMIVENFSKTGRRPLLVVDADPNSNLNEVLGIEVETTIGDIREDIARSELAVDDVIPKGMTKADYAEWKFSDSLLEQDDYDMIVMGRSQGKGCYCYVNGILTSQVAKYSKNYRYILMDNEAGMEHISRGILPKINTLLLVSDCSRRGIQAVARIAVMAEELDVRAGRMGLIVNRAPGGELNAGVREEIEKHGLELFGVIPHDDAVFEYDSDGRPSSKVPEDSPSKAALNALIEKLAI